MKKFLSVLLALAVAFTFTFGSTMSAFADTYYYSTGNTAFATQADADAAYIADVEAAEAVALGLLADQFATAYAKVNEKATYSVSSMDVEKSYVLAVLGSKDNPTATGTIYAAAYKAVKERTNALLGSGSLKGNATAKIDSSAYTSSPSAIKTSNELIEMIQDSTYAAKILENAFPAYRASVAAGVEGIDTSAYSTKEYTEDTYKDIPSYQNYTWEYPTDTTPKANYVAKENADKTIAYVAAAIKAVEIEAAGATPTLLEVKAAYSAVDAKLVKTPGAEGVTQVNYVTYDATNGYKLGQAYYTTAKEASDADKAETGKNLLKNVVINNISLAAEVTVDQNFNAGQIAAWTTLKDAYKAACDANIDNGIYTTADDVPAFPVYGSGYTLTKNTKTGAYDVTEVSTYYLANAEAIADTAVVAAAVKAKTNADGTAKYDADEVDKIVKGFNKNAYKTTASVGEIGAAKATALTEASFASAIKSYLTDYDKAYYKATVTDLVDADNMTCGSTEYYALEWAKVEAAVKAYTDAVDAATVIADITGEKGAFATLVEAFGKISDKSAVKSTMLTDVADTHKVYVAFQTVADKLDAYKRVLNSGLTGTDNELVFTLVNRADYANFFAENNARTADEITALYDKAAAELASAKSKKAVADECKAIVAKINALPATLKLTVADKDTAVAIYDEIEALPAAYAFKTDYANDYGKLTSALTTIAGLEKDAIDTAIDNLPTPAKLTLADKAALVAVKDAIEAYNDLYVTKLNLVSTYSTSYALALATSNIKALEKEAVENAIAALKTDGSDAEAIKAARAAYDAYVAEYTDYTRNHNAADEFTTAGKDLAKLEAAEAALAAVEEANKYDDIHAKADLLDMSRKLTIWRSSKTSIKVTAVGSVKNIKANGYTVQYKFYKKAPGATSYKLVKTTSSNKYTYTNLKKGTNKFQVKVVVKDADGKVVASKWTYYRAAKIK